MAEHAPLRIVYVFEDGEESDMALGTIDLLGHIEITRVAPGQEETVERMVADLNGSERVFLRDAHTNPETGRAAMVKKGIARGGPGFFDALRQTAQRFYKADLRFDPSVFGGGAVLMPDQDIQGDADQQDDTPPEPDMTPLPNAKPGMDV